MQTTGVRRNVQFHASDRTIIELWVLLDERARERWMGDARVRRALMRDKARREADEPLREAASA
jgi:hypothetical protein